MLGVPITTDIVVFWVPFEALIRTAKTKGPCTQQLGPGTSSWNTGLYMIIGYLDTYRKQTKQVPASYLCLSWKLENEGLVRKRRLEANIPVFEARGGDTMDTIQPMLY